MVEAFLLPLILHIAWIGWLYAWLTIARYPAVWGRGARDSDAARADELQPQAGLLAANLANQFELTPLAWFCALALLYFDAVTAVDVAAAWLFLVGRIIHSLVHVFADNIRLRGIVFMINAAGVAVLVVHLAWLVLAGGG